LAFVEDLIDLIRYEFVTKVYPQLTRKGTVHMDLPLNFDDHWKAVFARWQEKSVKSAGPKKMQTFAESKKGKKAQEKGGPPLKD
jgi:hypothetical protein